jgi:hypothetical protein
MFLFQVLPLQYSQGRWPNQDNNITTTNSAELHVQNNVGFQAILVFGGTYEVVAQVVGLGRFFSS